MPDDVRIAPRLPRPAPTASAKSALDDVAKAVARELARQNPRFAQFAGVTTLDIYDFDLTTAVTTNPVPLVNRITGEIVKNPRTGKEMLVGIGPTRSEVAERAVWERLYPELPWSEIFVDFEKAPADGRSLHSSQEIAVTLASIRRSNEDPTRRALCVTARADAGDALLKAMAQMVERGGARFEGILAPNSVQLRALSKTLDDAKLEYYDRKALTLAALVKLSGATKLNFIDDSHKNLNAVLAVLPKACPQVELNVIDVVKGPFGFVHYPVAYSPAGTSEVIGLARRPLDGYESPKDEPIAVEPHFADFLPSALELGE